MDQSQEYYPLDWNTNSFQYPSVGHIDLEVGKYYLWQIRRSFNTTFGEHHDYSSINVFEVRAPDKLQIDYSDPYLSVLESIIGEGGAGSRSAQLTPPSSDLYTPFPIDTLDRMELSPVPT